jgi:hypothetical protein
MPISMTRFGIHDPVQGKYLEKSRFYDQLYKEPSIKRSKYDYFMVAGYLLQEIETKLLRDVLNQKINRFV